MVGLAVGEQQAATDGVPGQVRAYLGAAAKPAPAAELAAWREVSESTAFEG